jgi:hypothetical protein
MSPAGQNFTFLEQENIYTSGLSVQTPFYFQFFFSWSSSLKLFFVLFECSDLISRGRIGISHLLKLRLCDWSTNMGGVNALWIFTV